MTADDRPVSGGSGGPQPEDAIGGGGGAGFEAVLAAAAYRGISRVLPSPDLARMAWALARDPRVPARHLMDLAVGWARSAWARPPAARRSIVASATARGPRTHG